MIILVFAALIGGALTLTQVSAWGLIWALALAPLGGSLAAFVAALLLVHQPLPLSLKRGPCRH